MKKNLVIWDFDGVIADSETIYLQNRQQYFNDKLCLNLDFAAAVKNFGGLSDFSNREVLATLGHQTNDDFWRDLVKIDEDIMGKGLPPTKGIEDIIKNLAKQCVATGGIMTRTITKLKLVGFWQKYFNEQNVFTGDMVAHGKPAPDIFLLAAQKMGEKPQDCIVVEDSIAGMTAAQKAGMDVIAFLGCKIYQNEEYIASVKALGIKNICFDMREVAELLQREF